MEITERIPDVNRG